LNLEFPSDDLEEFRLYQKRQFFYSYNPLPIFLPKLIPFIK
jgi:hypothetical protein